MTLSDEVISTLTAEITKIYESNLTESVLKRLDSFGYTSTQDDVFVIGFSVQKVENSIKNECNISNIPEGLICAAVDMVCGEILRVKYSTGKLTLDDLDLDGVIASVSAGDTSVSFDKTTSDDVKFNALLQMLTDRKGDLVCYRRIRW